MPNTKSWPLPRPRRVHARAPRAGFTLVELLVAVVVIGILAAVAIPRFANTTARANLANVKSDLHNLVTAEEGYFAEHGAYASSPALLNVSPSQGVTLTIVQATATGYSALAVHPASVPITCAVFYGQVAALPPATREGEIACQ